MSSVMTSKELIIKIHTKITYEIAYPIALQFSHLQQIERSKPIFTFIRTINPEQSHHKLTSPVSLLRSRH